MMRLQVLTLAVILQAACVPCQAQEGAPRSDASKPSSKQPDKSVPHAKPKPVYPTLTAQGQSEVRRRLKHVFKLPDGTIADFTNLATYQNVIGTCLFRPPEGEQIPTAMPNKQAEVDKWLDFPRWESAGYRTIRLTRWNDESRGIRTNIRLWDLWKDGTCLNADDAASPPMQRSVWFVCEIQKPGSASTPGFVVRRALSAGLFEVEAKVLTGNGDIHWISSEAGIGETSMRTILCRPTKDVREDALKNEREVFIFAPPTKRVVTVDPNDPTGKREVTVESYQTEMIGGRSVRVFHIVPAKMLRMTREALASAAASSEILFYDYDFARGMKPPLRVIAVKKPAPIPSPK